VLLALLLAALPPVSVDWSSVPDTVIERCDLFGLEAMVLQGMVDEGYAVVRSAGPGGIALVIRAGEDAFTVEGRRDDRSASRSIAIPSDCDSTIQVEILAGMREVSGELAADVLAPPPIETATVAPPAVELERLPWRIFGGVGAVLPSSTGMFAVRAGFRRRLADVWFLGLVLEGSVRPHSDVLVFEPVLAAQGVWELWSSASGIAVLLGLEAGVLAHLFTRDGDGGGHADGRFGLVLEGRLPILGATLLVMPYLRLIPVRQEVFGATAFEARHYGAVFALSVSFDL
jgi:hypothetical protein